MGNNAVSGHGASIGMELDPSGGQGTFTTVAELADLDWPELSRAMSPAPAHGDDIDYHVPAGILKRALVNLTLNFVYDHGTHDHATGLADALISKEARGYTLRGPAGSASDDEWIFSGHVTNFKQITPLDEGVRTANVSIQPSGPMIIDGTTVGS